MLRPFILIGVGGSGGKTLRVIRQTLRTRLTEARWPANKDLPAAWQFLQIDVATVADGDDPDLPPQLPPGQFLGMVGPGVTYGTLDTALGGALAPIDQLESLGGWKPDPNKVQVSIARGAGQYRALGRVVALNRLSEIKSRVSRMVDQVTDAGVRGELSDVARRLGQSNGTQAGADPVVIVISSIAGGSGAGALIDVCDVIRSTGKPWMDQSVGILYTPDVFDGIPAAGRRGVRPNALATLSELMAGYWSFEGRGGGITNSTAQLYRSRGIETSDINRLGPRFPILVGARNAEVFYGEQNEVYRGMGIALAEWATSESIQSRMNDYVTGNWAATAAGVPDKLGLKLNTQETPFSAFGFARLSLGRDLFTVYAAQRIARLAADRLRFQNSAARRPDDTRSDPEIIAALIDNAWPTFLYKSGLNEKGTEQNDIVDAIRPSDQKAVLDEWIAEATEAISPGPGVPGFTPVEWQQRIENHLRTHGPVVLGKIREARLVSARAWVKSIQVSFPEHALDTLAVHGAPVTLGLLQRLQVETASVVGELPEERHQLLARAERAKSEISAVLSTAGGQVPASSDYVSKAIKRAASFLYFNAEADLLGLVELLLRDLRDGLLEPVRRSVSHGSQKLEEDAKTSNGQPSVVEVWPTGDTVPKRLRPAVNEFLLDDVDSFPKIFTDLLMKDTGAAGALGAEDAVVRAVVVDADGRDAAANDSRPRPMLRLRDWQPGVEGLQESSAGTNPAVFTCSIEADQLLERAFDWVRNNQRNTGRYAAESLKKHLDDPNLDPSSKAERLTRFAGQWRATLERGKPLVNISSNLLSIVHETSTPRMSVIISSIPLDESSDAATVAADVLDSIDSQPHPPLFGDAVGQSVSVFWVLNEPYEPVVFSSIMQPIADEWASAAMDGNLRQSFWLWRRSRSMPEFLPMAPAVRRAMVRGWFTATALGQLEVPEPGTEAPVRIWIPGATGGEGAWLPFPTPPLRPYGSQADAIGSVLGATILAVLAVYSTQSLEPMRPYHRLIALGASGPAETVEEYETLNSALMDWLSSGGVQRGAPLPDEGKMGSPSDARDIRIARAQERLTTLRLNYTKRFDDVKRKGDVLSIPRDYELSGDILGALDDLLGRLGEMPSGGEFV